MQRRHLWALLLTAVLMVIYNLNGRDVESVDTLPATLLPVSLLKYGDANLNEFEGFFQPQPKIWEAGFVFGALQRQDGAIVSSYPLGAPLLATPVYALARAMGVLHPNDWLSYRLTGKLAASLMVAMSAGILFLTLSQWLSWGAALWLTLAYALGTGAFSTASQAMWQHGPGMLCLSVALWSVVVLERHSDRYALSQQCGLVFLLGLSLALAVWCRNVNVFAAGALSLYMLVYRRQLPLLMAYGLPLAVAAVWLAYDNYNTFGDVSGGYDAILDSQWHRSRNLLATGGLFQHAVGQGLLDTWLSPNKGLLIYSPFLLFAAAPLFTPARRQPLLWVCYLWIALFSLLLAKNSLWWGGTSFGPRYFLEVSAAMVLLMALAWPQLPRLGRYSLNLLVGLSIMIHSLGAFYAPCGWAETPQLADFAPERHWDWQDTEMGRCLAKGYAEGPLPRVFSLKDIF